MNKKSKEAIASTSETTLIKLTESQARTLQQILETLTSMNNGIPVHDLNSPKIIPNNQIRPFTCNNNHQTEVNGDDEVENPASVSEQQGNHTLYSLFILVISSSFESVYDLSIQTSVIFLRHPGI